MVSPVEVSSCPPHGADLCSKECEPPEGDCKMQDSSTAEGEAEADSETPNPLPPEADVKKAEGNTAFQAKQFEVAARLYAEAIAIAEAAGADVPGVYYSNRAVCLASLQDWEGTRIDAAKALARVTDLSAAAMKKALFQKARAELRLQLQAECQATLGLADQLGVRAEVERLLGNAQTESAPAAPAAPKEAQQAAAPPAPTAEALRAKEAGTAQYKEGNYRGALTEYRRALDLVGQDAGLRAQLLGNVAAACLMLKRTSDCVDACKECLALDPSNAKVRARLASAQVATGDFEAARATLGTAGDDPVLANAFKQIGSTQSTLAEADQALSNGEPAKALNIYANLESSVLFDFPPLTLKMAQCYLELKQYPRVLRRRHVVSHVSVRTCHSIHSALTSFQGLSIVMPGTRHSKSCGRIRETQVPWCCERRLVSFQHSPHVVDHRMPPLCSRQTDVRVVDSVHQKAQSHMIRLKQ
ncbi:TTL4 [Symbiodinium sp. CCMP2592]|nr:TTL4 [Symbiodinium sp. CCMP2592]